jgi:hypothetical protein
MALADFESQESGTTLEIIYIESSDDEVEQGHPCQI